MDGGGVGLRGSGEILRGTPGNVASDPDTVVVLQSGLLQGTGILTGDLVTKSGTVRPGTDSTTGQLTVDGTYTQEADGLIGAELGGTTAGSDYDLPTSKEAVLAGTLRVDPLSGFSPAPADTLTPVRWTTGTRSGIFDQINGREGFAPLFRPTTAPRP